MKSLLDVVQYIEYQDPNFWTVVGSIATTVGSIITAATFMFMFLSWQHDKKIQTSIFYLNEIKNCFAKVKKLIDVKDNSNMRWHGGIEILKIANDLKFRLTECEHQHIYIKEYLFFCSQLTEELKKITDHRFFYGVKDYQEYNTVDKLNELYRLTSKPHYYIRIDPDYLLFLRKFLIDSNYLCVNENEGWFKRSKFYLRIEQNKYICDLYSLNESTKAIYDYISKYLLQKKIHDRVATS
jgi:hypothetical protein